MRQTGQRLWEFPVKQIGGLFTKQAQHGHCLDGSEEGKER